MTGHTGFRAKGVRKPFWALRECNLRFSSMPQSSGSLGLDDNKRRQVYLYPDSWLSVCAIYGDGIRMPIC